jgi:hypothetical protein
VCSSCNECALLGQKNNDDKGGREYD